MRALRHDPAGFDPSYWRRGAELGWTSLLVSEENGGGTISGSGLIDLSLVAYEFGRHAAPGPLVSTNVVAETLSAHGAAPDVLASLLSGEGIATWCAPVAGPDGWRATLEAEHDGTDLVLRGEVRAVESAGTAAHLLVTCGDGGGTTQVLVHVVDQRRRGVADEDGRPDPSFLRRHLRGRAGPRRRGGRGKGRGLGGRRPSVPGVPGHPQRGVGRGLQTGFDMTVEWAFDRYSFGRPLASYQALKHRFADMMSWLEASHAISAAACAAAQERSADAPELVSAAKAYIGQYGAELLQDCVQLHGGIGVTFEHDLHLYLRRVIVDRALAGTPADHRQRIATIVAGRQGVAA